MNAKRYSRYSKALLALPLAGALLTGVLPTSLLLPPAQAAKMAHQKEGDRTVRTVGVSTNKDAAIARDEAIKDAQRKAVEEAVGVLIDAKTKVENLQLIDDEILTRTKGYIKTYKVVSENSGANGLLRVTIDAVVALGEIGSDIEDLADQIKMGADPRVVIVLDKSETSQQAESILSDFLLDKGFKVVDADQAAIGRIRRVASQMANGDLDPAARSALMPLADIIITGSIVPKPRKSDVIGDETFYGAIATANLKAIHVDTGLLIARKAKSSDPQRAVGSPDEAVEKAVKQATEDWIDDNLPRLIKAGIDPARTVTLTISGLNLSGQTALEGKLKSLRFARNVRSRDREGATADIDIEWVGTAKELAAQVEQIGQPSLNVTSITANTIIAKMR